MLKTIARTSFSIWVIGWIIWAYMVICSRTIRWTIEGEEEALEAWPSQTGVILAAWHSGIMLLPSGWNNVVKRWPNQKTQTAMMVSLSPDGQTMARAIQLLGLHAIRGSSTNKLKKSDKGGMRALAGAMRLLRNNGLLCMTPDGPRGPNRTVQEGPIYISQRSGAPIIPMAVVSTPHRKMNSWDRFRVPLPFSRGYILFGDPILPDPDIEREVLRVRLQASLNDVTDRADALLEKKGHPEGQPKSSKKDVAG